MTIDESLGLHRYGPYTLEQAMKAHGRGGGREKRCSSTISLTSALDGCQRHASAALLSGKNSVPVV